MPPARGENDASARADRRVRAVLREGILIPAHPLALDSARKLDERRQRALSRYYLAAGAGGLAVGVHMTQFAIRDPRHGLFRPVLALAAEEMDRFRDRGGAEPVRIAGICGPTEQAVAEAELARELGYHAGLLSLGGLGGWTDDALVAHARAVAGVMPVVGFYLQPAAGGRDLSAAFWRRFAEIEGVVAVKIACFDRYRTIDVIRAFAEAGRDDVALYTGNDDNIVADLLTPFRFRIAGRTALRRISGGLLGHWSVWTRRAAEIFADVKAAAAAGTVPEALLGTGAEITDANAAFFDAANAFRGCVAGIHEVLRRQGLLAGAVALDPDAGLSPGQLAEIDRVLAAYPHLADDEFVAAHRDEWLR